MHGHDVEGYVPFSQRHGFSEIPPQLELGVVTDQQKLLLNYAWDRELSRNRNARIPSVSDMRIRVLSHDAFVKVLGISPSSLSGGIEYLSQTFSLFVNGAKIGTLYDLIEFIIRHVSCSSILVQEFSDAFVETRSAYRIVDKKIIALGTEQQAEAVKQALNDVEAVGARAAKAHLISAGGEIRHGNWADSVRESIHAVEAMARKIDPSAKTLGAALKTLERSNYIHGSLKEGFNRLYGYTNDEEGIRHSLLEETARVDEVDALFMLGACASFVSYLIARERAR